MAEIFLVKNSLTLTTLKLYGSELMARVNYHSATVAPNLSITFSLVLPEEQTNAPCQEHNLFGRASSVHPTGGWTYYFCFFRRPTWFPDILGNSCYPIFTKFGMQVYWVNSLYGIAFGDNTSIAN